MLSDAYDAKCFARKIFGVTHGLSFLMSQSYV
jgi:hypothetical protein